MRCFSLVLIGFFFSSVTVFSQEVYTKHTISKGETISAIAEQYKVKQSAIYKINPNAKKLLKLNSVLLIPTNGAKQSDEAPEKPLNYSTKTTHVVLAKETPYGIAKQYGISIEDLYKINPELEKAGLKVGQEIIVSDLSKEKSLSKTGLVKEGSKKTIAAESIDNTQIATEKIIHEVLLKETKYSIAKQYGIPVADLEKANPILGKSSLKKGQKIIIPVKEGTIGNAKVENEAGNINSKIAVVENTESKTVISTLPENAENDKKIGEEIIHEVLPKETKYAIAKQYGITIAELEKQNPAIAKKLIVGCKLSIRGSKLTNVNHTGGENDVVVVNDSIATSGAVVNGEFNSHSKSFLSEDFIDELVKTASENIGVRYRSGGTTRSGFDCSGLMFSTFGNFDITLPRSSIEQSRIGVKVNFEDAQKGDLIFFKTNGRSHINHVGMVVEVCEGEIKFIHSSVHNGVIISSTKENYYEKKLSQINRVTQ